jgi:hypothetical protein
MQCGCLGRLGANLVTLGWLGALFLEAANLAATSRNVSDSLSPARPGPSRLIALVAA